MASEERSTMKEFWNAQAQNADNNEMCLHHDADTVGLEEIPEILSYLPDLAGKRILELACGIGRFTGHLAKQAKHVTTVDFMEKYVAKNRELNAAHENITYIADDVMNLSFEENSFDVIFSNWILIYLNDEEVNRCLERLLRWLTDGGFLFFRESCYRTAGDSWNGDNPSLYRNPEQNNRLLLNACIDDPGGAGGQGSAHLELIYTRHLLSLVRLMEHRGSICWLLQKKNGVKPPAPPAYQSPSEDLQRTEQGHIKMLDLQPGQNLLHIGCGDGYLDFHLINEYGVHVHAIDESYRAIEAAWERKALEQSKKTIPICFESGDVIQRPFPVGLFDVVYVASGLNGNSSKIAIWTNILPCLKTSGKLLIRDSENNDLVEDLTKVFGGSMRITYKQSDKHQVQWVIAEKTN